jgi:hypothetical protein
MFCQQLMQIVLWAVAIWVSGGEGWNRDIAKPTDEERLRSDDGFNGQ